MAAEGGHREVFAAAVCARVAGARLVGAGEILIDEVRGLSVLLWERGFTATFRSDAAYSIVGTTRRRKQLYPRLAEEGSVAWHALDARVADLSAPPDFRRSIEGIARSAAVDVHIGGGTGRVDAAYHEGLASPERLVDAIEGLSAAVRALPMPSSAEPIEGPFRVISARVVDRARLRELLARTESPLPDRDDPFVLVGDEPWPEPLTRALVVDVDGAVCSGHAVLEAWPHSLVPAANGLPALPPPRPGSTRTSCQFEVELRGPAELEWQLSSMFHVYARGRVPVVTFPGGLLSHIATGLPGARVEHDVVHVPGPPPARIRVSGEWSGEGRDREAPTKLLPSDPLHRAAHRRFVHALAAEWRGAPHLHVEADEPPGRGWPTPEARRRAAELGLRISSRGGRAAVVGSIAGLPPSMIERRIETALALLQGLHGGA